MRTGTAAPLLRAALALTGLLLGAVLLALVLAVAGLGYADLPAVRAELLAVWLPLLPTVIGALLLAFAVVLVVSLAVPALERIGVDLDADGTSRSTDPALDELRLAYARGDLSDEEFERRRERLAASRRG
jgi:uncharacterized membrane protein